VTVFKILIDAKLCFATLSFFTNIKVDNYLVTLLSRVWVRFVPKNFVQMFSNSKRRGQEDCKRAGQSQVRLKFFMNQKISCGRENRSLRFVKLLFTAFSFQRSSHEESTRQTSSDGRSATIEKYYFKKMYFPFCLLNFSHLDQILPKHVTF
jgi:hypothetical protein